MELLLEDFTKKGDPPMGAVVAKTPDASHKAAYTIRELQSFMVASGGNKSNLNLRRRVLLQLGVPLGTLDSLVH